MSVTTAVADRYAAARTDAGLVEAALYVEQLGALAYAAAAAGPLAGPRRAEAERFAGHEREHAAAFATMLLALTVPVRVHASEADVTALLPEVRGERPREALEALAELEARSDRGPSDPGAPTTRRRRPAHGGNGHGRRRPAPRRPAVRPRPAADQSFRKRPLSRYPA